MQGKRGAGARLGIIGGSGFYGMEGLTSVEEVRVETPFGPPSDAFVVGELEGTPVGFLARHGRGHLAPPTRIKVKANIWGYKSLGAEGFISVRGVGSMSGA